MQLQEYIVDDADDDDVGMDFEGAEAAKTSPLIDLEATDADGDAPITANLGKRTCAAATGAGRRNRLRRTN